LKKPKQAVGKLRSEIKKG